MTREPTSPPSVHLGLRSRLIAAFALGALTLSVLMGAIAYFTTRHTLVVEKQDAALHQAYANAALLRNALSNNVPSISDVVASLDTGSGTTSLLNDHEQWFSTSLSVSLTSIPPSARQVVEAGSVATQTAPGSGAPNLIVGVPIPAVHSAYYLLYDLTDLQHTLRVLLIALGAAAAATTLLGAGVGLIASRRTMRPLTEVSQAAVSIAEGDLSTRLPVDRWDPDLSGLTSSFNAMVDRLEDRIDRDARFTSDVSHELRSPLTTLSASLGVLEANRSSLDDRSRQALDLMAGDLRRFQRLVTDLLEISRIDADSDTLVLEEVRAGELVRRSVAQASSVLPAMDAPAVHIADEAERAILEVDKRRFERVMGNLLENALAYAGGATSVDVDVSGDGSHVEVSVTDEGTGIEPGERERIFDRFYRGSTSGRRGNSEGSGLGLALVAEHVRRQHGTVRVVDNPDATGTVFIVSLPIVVATPLTDEEEGT